MKTLMAYVTSSDKLERYIDFSDSCFFVPTSAKIQKGEYSGGKFGEGKRNKKASGKFAEKYNKENTKHNTKRKRGLRGWALRDTQIDH